MVHFVLRVKHLGSGFDSRLNQKKQKKSTQDYKMSVKEKWQSIAVLHSY